MTWCCALQAIVKLETLDDGDGYGYGRTLNINIHAYSSSCSSHAFRTPPMQLRQHVKPSSKSID